MTTSNAKVARFRFLRNAHYTMNFTTTLNCGATEIFAICFISVLVAWKQGKLRPLICITVTMLVEALLVLLPLGIVLLCTGVLYTSILAFVARSLVSGIVFGLLGGLFGGLSYGIVGGLFGGLVYFFISGLVFALLVGLYSIFGSDFVFGPHLIFGLRFVLCPILVLIGGLIGGLNYGLMSGLGIFAGVNGGLLIFRWGRELFKSGIGSITHFFTPWRSERLYFRQSVGFFAIVYLGFVLLFALWFYASYLNANKVIGVWLSPPNPYFNTEKVIGVPNYWTFVYFSFITIASLGYGDIYPIHWISQILVILETIVGVGLIAGFLAVIISVGGRDRKQPEMIDPYIDTDL